MNLFGDLMITALYTAFFQNLVLSFAYGTSEAVRVSLKPRSFGLFTVMISGFAVVTAAICHPLDRLPRVSALTDSMHALVQKRLLLPRESRFRSRRGRCLCCGGGSFSRGSAQTLRKQGDSAGVQGHPRHLPLHKSSLARIRGVFGQFGFLIRRRYEEKDD